MQGSPAWCDQQSVHAYLDLAAAVMFLPDASKPEFDATFTKLQHLGDAMDFESVDGLAGPATSSWGTQFGHMRRGRNFQEPLPDLKDLPAVSNAAFEAPKAAAATAMWGAYQQQRAQAEAERSAMKRAMAAKDDPATAHAAADAARKDAVSQQARTAAGSDVAAANEVMQSLGQQMLEASLDEQERLVERAKQSDFSVPQYEAFKAAAEVSPQSKSTSNASASAAAGSAGAASSAGCRQQPTRNTAAAAAAQDGSMAAHAGDEPEQDSRGTRQQSPEVDANGGGTGSAARDAGVSRSSKGTAQSKQGDDATANAVEVEEAAPWAWMDL